VLADQLIARGEIWCGKDRLDPFEWHVQGAESADDLSDGDLLGRVATVAGVWVDVRWFEQADLVVVAQHLRARLRGASELAN
jgi:hypothetical protein